MYALVINTERYARCNWASRSIDAVDERARSAIATYRLAERAEKASHEHI